MTEENNTVEVDTTGAEPAKAVDTTETTSATEVKATTEQPTDKASEVKTEEVKTEDKKVEEKKPETPVKKAPEKYELKDPDGVKISDTVRGKVEEYARKHDLSNDQAQELANMAPEISKMFTDTLAQKAKEVSAVWASEALTDKELSNGGDKAVLEKNLALVSKAKKAYCSPQLLDLLNNFDAEANPGGTGLGNHPEILRHFLTLGRQIAEDGKLISGTATPPRDQTHAQKLYG